MRPKGFFGHTAPTVMRQNIAAVTSCFGLKALLAVRRSYGRKRALTAARTDSYGLLRSCGNHRNWSFCCRKVSAIITPVPCGRTLGGRWDQQIAENKSRPRTERERERERAFNPISSP